MKILLEHPANVQDLLHLAGLPWLDEIDFRRLDYIKTTFVRRDYRHLESDIVLTVPLIGKGGRSRKLLIYILIEHQSEPDELMPLRLVDAQVQIFRYQLRYLAEAHGARRRVRLAPVLPLVFYTGLRSWPQVGTLVDLIRQAHHRCRHEAVLQLCGAMEPLLIHRGHHWRCVEAFEWGVRSAQKLGQAGPQARLHAMHGRVLTLLHEFERAQAALDTAAEFTADLDDPVQVTSILEYQGRLQEEQAEHHDPPDFTRAIQLLRRAVEIDQQAGEARALSLHRRMLANLLVKVDRAAQARDLLEPHLGSLGEDRNTARVHMVLAKAYTNLDDLDQARAAVAQARALLGPTGADQYDLELADIEGEIACRAGDIDAARACWGHAADRYGDWGHPKVDVYLRKLGRLPPLPR
jgi:tetratricopeptide (TPR) repeat protein